MDFLADLFNMRPFYFVLLVFFILLWSLWIFLRKRKPGVYEIGDSIPLEPLPLHFGLSDHLKAFISWIFLFARVFSVKPGLYYIGKQPDRMQFEKAPLLVTCNNFLTVFLLARRIKPRNVQLLVVDTEEINVWCSSAKGRFSAHEIIEKASLAGLVGEGKKISMVLPKFSLAGVNLTILKKAGIHPIIGPLYSNDLPAYLDEGRFEDRVNDRVHFGLQSRAFTAPPTAFQFLLYFGGAYIFTLGLGTPLMIWIAVALAFSYPILFPYLPSRLFAVKGIFLGLLASLITLIYFYSTQRSYYEAIPVLLFLFATSIFVGLSYTGSSAVSNYSRVRKEIAHFLLVVIVLYLLVIPAWFLF
jgi:hypothetical protein